MTDARIYTTQAGAQRLSDAVDAAKGIRAGRRRTQADLIVRGPPDEDGNPGLVISGTVSYSGGGRHVQVEDTIEKPWAHIVSKGSDFAYPWDAEVGKLSGQTHNGYKIPVGPNGTMPEALESL